MSIFLLCLLFFFLWRDARQPICWDRGEDDIITPFPSRCWDSECDIDTEERLNQNRNLKLNFALKEMYFEKYKC